MPSPFPGMNPYLEQQDVWHDFHQRFVPRIADALGGQIRPTYLAKVDENVYIHELSAEERFLLGRPDVSVLVGDKATKHSTMAQATAPRSFGHLLPATDRITEPFIEIRDRESRELITVIELLSPTNKELGPDRDQYLAKRRQILASRAHLVEIDLLRGGPRMPVDGWPPCDYAVLVSRYHERPRVDLWPLRLREPLPVIPVPLRHPDADAVLDLQQLLQEQFDAAGYEDYIYQGQPRPPLERENDDWARKIVNGE